MTSPCTWLMTSPWFTCASCNYRGYSVPLGIDEVNPGLVADGTLCGTGRICRAQQCVSVTTTPCPNGANGQECSGQGVSRISYWIIRYLRSLSFLMFL